MLDVRSFRTEPDVIRQSLARRGADVGAVDEVIELDKRRRELAGRRDDVRRAIKETSREVGQFRRDGDDTAAEAAAEKSRALGDQEDQLAAEEANTAARLNDLLLRIPNVIHPDTPDGESDADNPTVRMVNYDPANYEGSTWVPHWETGEALGILDNGRAVKISGSMFTMLRGQGATLARALCQLALDNNADAFEEVRPPSLVTTATLTATGQLPKFADDAYAIERDDLWCIPTAEVPLTSLASGDVLDEADLPQRFMAYSPCYRREAGSAGRDTRGLLRTHEFDKVEILAYATPEQAPPMLDELLRRAEATIASLGLAYRIIEICSGDLGQSHHRSFDIEVYAPGCAQWLEVSSVSWFADYQARRANIRFRPTTAPGDDKRPNEMVHTLNGSALAVPRVWAAIVETHRNDDGTVTIPEPLRPYMRGATVIS